MPWTIGYGHTAGVRPGQVVSHARAFQLLKADLRDAENAVNKLVRVPINQNRFDALVSLVFNIGVGNFKNSTLLHKLNARDYRGASAEFGRWNKAGQPSHVMDGLTIRRAAERRLFDRSV